MTDMRMGFVIVSHNDPAQLLELCHALNQLYDYPQIACHHDNSQCAIDQGQFSSNVQFVSQPLVTRWADWSVTAAVIKGIDLLYRTEGPDWFTLLSAVDYPVSPAAAVSQELASATCDIFMDLRMLDGQRQDRHTGEYDRYLVHHDNAVLATRRYNSMRMPIPTLTRDRTKRQRTIRLPFRPLISPFGNDYRCYVGSQWFTATRRVAQSIINPNAFDTKYATYLKTRWHADESYVNTLIGNRRDITVDVNPRRFTVWDQGSPHPRILDESLVPTMIDSKAFFARKFARGSRSISVLNEHLGIAR